MGNALMSTEMAAQADARQKDSRFLVVVDNTPECRNAWQFAARRAQHVGGSVVLAHIIDPPDFQHWMSVEDVMREEARQDALEILRSVAVQIEDDIGPRPELVVREGKAAEQILQILEEDPAIQYFILAAGSEKDSPGPLVSTFSGSLISAMPVPVVIVPGHLSVDQIEQIA
jgi:nucleotide-binding universal stress UspA family protein